MKKTFTSRCIPALFVVSMLLAALAPAAHAQGPWTWATPSVSTVNGRAWAEQNAVDAAGDVYVTGAFHGTVNFPGAGPLSSVLNTADVFVGKLNGVTGQWIWVVQGLAPGGKDSGYGICVDNAGSVYVTGTIQGSAIQFLPLGPVGGFGPDDDVFVAKFSAATGACTGLTIGGGTPNDDAGRSIVWMPQIPGTPPGGFLFVTGDFRSAVATFGSTTLANTVAVGTADIFVAQLSAATLTWGNAVSAGGADNDSGQGITMSYSTSSANAPAVYVTGAFESGTALFGSTPLSNYAGSSAPPDIFVSKLTPGLGWLWTSQAGGTGRDVGHDVVYDVTSGDVYATGHFENTPGTAAGTAPAAFGTNTFPMSTLFGGTDVYVARLKATNGQWVWARQAGGVLNDTGSSIERDVSGRLYAVGAYDSPAGQFGSTILPNSNPGVSDVFVTKFTNAGAWMWSRTDGGPGPDESKGVALSAPSTVFVSGGFFTPASFSPFTLTSFSRDAWVGRLPGTLPNLTISTPTIVPAGGAYNNIVVTGTGVAILSGPLFAAGSVLVQPGGVWTSNCNILSGPGSFNLSAGATINICSTQGISLTGATGDIQVTGTRTYSTDAIYRYVNPSLAQISGTGLVGARDLEVVTPGGVTLTQGVQVRRLLTMAPGSGNLSLATWPLLLLSTATQTAMVINAPGGGIVTGNTAQHQRYVDPTFSVAPGFRHISSPMTNSVVSDLTCTGYTVVPNPAFDPVSNPTPVPLPTIYGFNEAQYPASPVFANGWFSPAALTTPMGTGRGWSGYMKAPIKPVFRGTLQNGNVNVGPLTQTGGFLAPTQKSGWALVGNPYPAPIDLGLVALPAGVQNTASVWTTTGGSTGFYTTYPLGTGSSVLPMGQGFYVRALTSGPILTFTNACRATAYVNPPFYRPARVAATQPTVRLTLASATDPALHQPEATIVFAPDAAAGLDERYDQAVPGPNVGHPTLLCLTPQGEELAVNGLPTAVLTTGTTVPLLLDVPTAGTYELAVREIALFDADGTPLTLLDRLTGTRYDLRQHRTLLLTLAAGESRGRFEVVIGQRPLGTDQVTANAAGVEAWPNPGAGVIHVSLPSGVATLTVLDVTGRVVRTVAATAGRLAMTGLPAGIYTLRAGVATQRLVVE